MGYLGVGKVSNGFGAPWRFIWTEFQPEILNFGPVPVTFMVLEYLEIDSGILGSSGAVLGVLPETLGARITPCGHPSSVLQANIKEILRFQHS